MTYIKNFKVTEDILQFEIDNISNKINISLVNAIRRTIISDIESYVIDEKNISFFHNNSMLNDEFLIHRLKLIPIISNLDDIDYENLIISCKKNNDGENMLSVYVKDFVCTDRGNIVEIDKIFKYPGILFGKLKNNQEVIFEAKLNKNNSEKGGSFYSTVSKCVYIFKQDNLKINECIKDMNETEKRAFNTLEAERLYEINKNGYPNTYQFTIEPIGFYDSINILKIGLKLLIEKLNIVKYEFTNKGSNKIKIIYKDDSPDFHHFLIDNENETIGNLLQTYIVYNTNVLFCGFVIEHPLKKNILFKIKLNDDNTIESAINVILKNIDIIDNILNDLFNEIMTY